MSYQNLRGDIKDWIIYVSSSSIVNPRSNQVKRIVVSSNTVEKESVGNNTFNYQFPIQNELMPITFIRVGYVDSNGMKAI